MKIKTKTQIPYKKPYSVQKGKRFFDWNKFLNRKKITDKEWLAADILAWDWVTCACGNVCGIIPRKTSHNEEDLSKLDMSLNAPLDNKLRDLGYDFSSFISQQDIKTAKKTLKKIEKRSATIIRGILKTTDSLHH